MKLEELVKWFDEHPYGLRMGAGKLSKRLKCEVADIHMAKNLSRGMSVKRMPKILIFDLEMAPLRAYVWSRWKQNVSLNQTISENFIICWSAKWLYEDKVYGESLTTNEILEENDRRIVSDLWDLVNEADIIIAHNAKHADIPWMNSRFIIHGFLPTKPYQIIDTLEVAKKYFGFSSNKLDALAGYFGIQHKLETGFELWAECMKGNPDALNYMLKYNNVDVKILEEVYLKLRPWIKNHPNVGNIMELDVCPHCGCDSYEPLDEFYYTSVGKYRLYRCKDCGTVFRARLGEKDFKPEIISAR